MEMAKSDGQQVDNTLTDAANAAYASNIQSIRQTISLLQYAIFSIVIAVIGLFGWMAMAAYLGPSQLLFSIKMIIVLMILVATVLIAAMPYFHVRDI